MQTDKGKGEKYMFIDTIYEQAKKNLSAMLDAVLEKYPNGTLEVLGLCCFIEPEDVDNHEVSEYLTAFTEIINNEAVLGFFTSLIKLGQTDTLTA